MPISNYGELKSEIGKWLNRSDLSAQIPTFITLAELMIFRRLRLPISEATALYTLPAGGFELTLPTDYVETIDFRIEGKPPLDLITRGQLLARRGNNPWTSEPTHYARVGSTLWVWPTPSGEHEMVLQYYADGSARLVNDADESDMLRIAPDLYLYGALIKAEPYLSRTELEKLPIWKAEFNEGVEALEMQHENAELSGGTMEVESASDLR